MLCPVPRMKTAATLSFHRDANMKLIDRYVRRLLGVASAPALAACGSGKSPDLIFPFDIPKDVQLDATGTSVSGVYAFDLPSGSISLPRDMNRVKALRLDSLDITVTDTTTTGSGGGTNAASSITVIVALRPGAATTAASDVQVGSLTNFAIAKNATTTLPGSVDLFTMTIGTGQFNVVISGTSTPGAAHLLLHMVPHVTWVFGP
jgi:hypothetical protein